MHHLWSFLCFIIKSKLTTYLVMKTSGPGSAQEGLATAQHRRKRSGISSETPPKCRSALELHKSDALQNKIDFPSIGKNVIFCKKEKRNTLPCFFP